MTPHTIKFRQDALEIGDAIFIAQPPIERLESLLGRAALRASRQGASEPDNPEQQWWDWPELGLRVWGKADGTATSLVLWLEDTATNTWTPFSGALSVFGVPYTADLTPKDYFTKLLRDHAFTDDSDAGDLDRNRHLDKSVSKRYSFGRIYSDRCATWLVASEWGGGARQAYTIGFSFASPFSKTRPVSTVQAVPAQTATQPQPTFESRAGTVGGGFSQRIGEMVADAFVRLLRPVFALLTIGFLVWYFALRK